MGHFALLNVCAAVSFSEAIVSCQKRLTQVADSTVWSICATTLNHVADSSTDQSENPNKQNKSETRRLWVSYRTPESATSRFPMRTPSVASAYVADWPLTNFDPTFISHDEWQSDTFQPATWSQLPLDVPNHDPRPKSQDGVTHEVWERQFSLENWAS